MTRTRISAFDFAIPAISHETLTKERNYFLFGFFVLVAIGIVFRAFGATIEPSSIELYTNFAVIFTGFAKLLFILLVARLSKFLGNPTWMTLLYIVLAPFSLLYLIPFVGLLIGVVKARKNLTPSKPEEDILAAHEAASEGSRSDL